MERLTAQGRALGEKAAADARDRITRRAAEALPGVEAHAEGDAVVLTGRRLTARLLREPVLRWIGSLMR